MSKSRKDYKLYFLDIISSCKKILTYTRGLNFEKFSNDSKTIDAVIRNLEVIGEAASKIPLNVREKIPEIPWPKIVGLRNKVIHEYFDVNVPIIWETVQKDIPVLQKQVKKILEEVDSGQLKLN